MGERIFAHVSMLFGYNCTSRMRLWVPCTLPFHTTQSLSMLTDVCRAKTLPEKTVWDLDVHR